MYLTDATASDTIKDIIEMKLDPVRCIIALMHHAYIFRAKSMDALYTVLIEHLQTVSSG